CPLSWEVSQDISLSEGREPKNATVCPESLGPCECHPRSHNRAPRYDPLRCWSWLRRRRCRLASSRPASRSTLPGRFSMLGRLTLGVGANGGRGHRNLGCGLGVSARWSSRVSGGGRRSGSFYDS